MAQNEIKTDDDDYNSASDEDFNPEATKAGSDVEASSEDETDGTNAPTNKRKKTATVDNLDFNNSGDEATITRARRKKRRVKYQEEPEDGGEGGLVKTRAQRKTQITEKKQLVESDKSSVDVDAIWARMAEGTQAPAEQNRTPDTQEVLSTINAAESSNCPTNLPDASKSTKSPDPNADGTIIIKRKYDFAGQTLEEERTVPATSAEARLYLEAQSTQAPTHTTPRPPIRRPMKRASMFGSNTKANGKGLTAFTGEAPKLNTIEKSKLDWAAHIDQEGISDELDEHRRAKGGYLERMDFLGRTEAKREEDLRTIKPK